METQSGRKPRNDFSYMYLRITFIGSTNFLCFPTATGRRIQPPSFSGYNLEGRSNSPILWLQPPSFSGYNLREAPTPQLSGYNPLVSQATT
jgi:hypothetical protein